MSLIQRAKQQGIKPSLPTSNTQVLPKQGGILQGLANASDSAFRNLTQLGVGALKGAGSTIANIGELGARTIFKPIDMLTGANQIQSGDTERGLNTVIGTQSSLTPTNTAQKIGFGAEQMGEFFLPMGAAAKGVKAAEAGIDTLKLGKAGAQLARDIGFGRQGAKLGASLLEGGAKLGTRAGIDAGIGAGVTVAQGGDKEEILTNALISGSIPFFGTALKALKPLAKGTANKIESVLIKPSARDIKDGFNVNNIFKYKLGGSLESTAKKTETLIEQKATELRNLIKNNPVSVNINSLIDAAEAELGANKASNFGINSKLKNAFNTLREEVKQLTADGNVSLVDAQQIKRSVGKLGAWQYGVRDPDASALEKAANTLYTQIRRYIEEVSPPALRRVNKELSELIPIENAIIRRLPVAERGEIGSLKDIISLSASAINPSNLWLFVLNRMGKSGNVANVLNTLGTNPQSRSAAGTAIFGSPKPLK